MSELPEGDLFLPSENPAEDEHIHCQEAGCENTMLKKAAFIASTRTGKNRRLVCEACYNHMRKTVSGSVTSKQSNVSKHT